MYAKKMKYTDFNGNEREETFYFHLTEADLTKWNFEKPGGLEAHLNRIMEEQDPNKLIVLFDELISRSYGVKDLDGRGFVKTPEELAKFKSTQAYSDLYIQLATDANAAAEFVRKVIPKGLAQKLAAMEASGEISPIRPVQ